MLSRMMLKLFGKRIIEGTLQKYGISKAKVILVVDVLLYATEAIAPQFGWHVDFGQLKEALLAAGLWAARDGQSTVIGKTDATASTPDA